MVLYQFVVLEMTQIQFFDDVLHGDKAVVVLLDDVSLDFLDIGTDVPSLQRVAAARYQPHLIDNKLQHNPNTPSHPAPIHQYFLPASHKISTNKLEALPLLPKFVNIILHYKENMNQLTDLFNQQAFKQPFHKVESKEEFFTTKKNNKRMKASLCLSDSIETPETLSPKHDLSLGCTHNQDTLNTDNKELDSTFSEEPQFNFKIKPPKRKINTKHAHKQNQSFSFDKEEPLISTLFQKKLAKQCSPQQPQSQPSGKNIKITDFSFIKKIGQGSYSQVFQAVHKDTGFLCAIKVLQKKLMKLENAQQNVVRELKITLFANHPNITKLYSFFSDQDNIYLLCEYATDKNLYETLYQPKLKLIKGFKTDAAAAFTKQICSAVQYLHTNRIMHRDIKPENILITMDSTIKICDFGWSIYNPSNTLRSTFCGTPLYLAPELIAQKYYDQSVDIWAVGIITYEMMTESIPFDINCPNDLVRILSDEVKLSRIRNKTACDFIQKALQKQPMNRITIFQLCQHPFIQ